MIDIQALNDDEKKELINNIIKRMCTAYGIEAHKGFQKLLAEHIAVSDSTVKSWVFNKRVPFDEMLKCAAITNTSFDYLLTGVEPVPSFNAETRQKVTSEVINLVVNAKRFNLLEQDDGLDMFANGVVEVVLEVLY